MKVLMLADHSSAHTLRWVTSLSEKGVELFLFSLSDSGTMAYDNLKNLQLNHSEFSTDKMREDGAGWSKLKYLKELKSLRAVAREFKPDLVHSHYATSYGLLGVLLGVRPFLISVWGSDVYDFPNRSFLHKSVLKYILKKADGIFSTSENMALETKKYTNKPIKVIPFGIDLEVFKPKESKNSELEGPLVIGTIKSMERVYGIDILIKAFSLLINEGHDCKLLLVGGGTKLEEYKDLVSSLKLNNKVEFTGNIPHNQVVNKYHELDIYAALSRRESFGVAVLEASACGIPVVVSNVGGLPEVVKDGKTGIILTENTEIEAFKAFEKLIRNKETRIEFAEQGCEWVNSNYNWEANVKNMIYSYQNLIQ